MKKSIYSTELSLSDRLVLFYNALTDSFVVAKRKEGESMEELRKKYVQSLIDGGFFVEDSVDESEVLQSRLRTVLNDKRAFHLTNYKSNLRVQLLLLVLLRRKEERNYNV